MKIKWEKTEVHSTTVWCSGRNREFKIYQEYLKVYGKRSDPVWVTDTKFTGEGRWMYAWNTSKNLENAKQYVKEFCEGD